MATIKRFEEIDAWKVARELCGKVGIVIDNGNFKNSYKLIGQIEGSSGSIMDNIAEGFERGTRAEFIQFLGYSKGSCGELRSQLYRAFDRNYLTKEQFDEFYLMAVRVSAMLQKLIEYLQKTDVKGVRKKQPLNP
jgi:four helix bundle protein